MQSQEKAQLLTIFSVLFILVLGWGIALQFTIFHQTIFHQAYNLGIGLIYLLSSIVCLTSVSSSSAPIYKKKAIQFFGLALFTLATQLFVQSFLVITQIRMTSDIIAYIFFAVFLVFLLLGNYYYFRSLELTRVILHVIEIFVVAILSGLLIYFYLLPPINLPTIHEYMNYGIYLLVDVIIITIAYTITRFIRHQRSLSMLIFALGLLTMVVADIVYQIRFSQRIWWMGDISDLIYCTTSFLLGIGLISRSIDQESELPPPTQTPLPGNI